MFLGSSYLFIIINRTFNKNPSLRMFRATVSAATVINRVAKTQILVIKRVRVLGRGPHTPTQLFWKYPLWANYQEPRANPLPRVRRSLDLARFSHFNIDNEKATH